MEQAKIVPKQWGREIWITNREKENYCGKVLEVNPGHRFSLHLHDVKDETFWVLEGKGQLTTIDTAIGKEIVERLEKDSIVHIPRLLPHEVYNDSTEILKIVEFSTFHRDEDSYRIWRR
jgi:mannose-6-phosphate isomerase-like protein (cupin superfamily)